MSPFIIISLTAIFALAMLLLRREGIFEDRAALICAAVLTAAALIIRAFYYNIESDDYLTFLAPWTQYFRDNGGFAALADFPGNYNPPYMYLLAAFSYLDIPELYLIKSLSVLFDVLLAFACMKLASLYSDSKARRLGVFLAVLWLPTVAANGAYWAQCDSIYAFFGVYALYLGMSSRGAGAMVSLAASLAFKLQAVFVIPAFFILLLAKRIKWRQLLIFPAAYIALMLPAVIAGAPLWDTLTLYISQAGTVGDAMNYNAPSLTCMFSWTGDTTRSARLLIIAAFLLVAAVYAAALLLRRRLSDRLILALTLILVMGIPYLLPHMHDRYFYLAGVLALVLASTDLRFAPVPLFAELASLHCYYAYFVRYYLVQPRIGGELMLASLLLCAAYAALYAQKPRKFEINP